MTGSLTPEPLRGEVWDADMPRVGPHPVVILTINPLLQRLSSTTAVLVTGTGGPRSTHVPLGREAGLTRHDESYAVATELHNVPLLDLVEHRGRLAAVELRALEEAIRIAHGLADLGA
ncbi:MAG: type II toxin-antitoxin system PemK/MazF family toxin [Actinomycetota bacterium]|nr:type II toxin-antitoxin system PemK/MazF family toxin [Actinomycetota bacterium]